MFVSLPFDEVKQLFQFRERDAAELRLFDRCLLRAEETEVGTSAQSTQSAKTADSRGGLRSRAVLPVGHSGLSSPLPLRNGLSVYSCGRASSTPHCASALQPVFSRSHHLGTAQAHVGHETWTFYCSCRSTISGRPQSSQLLYHTKYSRRVRSLYASLILLKIVKLRKLLKS